MLKKLMVMLAFVLPSFAVAQNVLSSQQMVAVTPMLSSKIELPQGVRSLLAQKLGQIVTQNGFGSVSSQFILTSNVVFTDTQATSTAPVRYIAKGDASFFLIDVSSGVVLDEYTMAVQGIDQSDEKAKIKAVSQINPKNPNIRNFMSQARNKVIDYYTTNIPNIMTQARSLSNEGRYAEAIVMLESVPEFLPEYPAVAQLRDEIAAKMPKKEDGQDSLLSSRVRQLLQEALDRWYVSRFVSAI